MWFVFVLFLLYAALPILLYMFRGKVLVLLLLTALLQFLPATEYFAIYSFREYLFVFLLGFFVFRPQEDERKYYFFLVKHLDRWWMFWCVLFIFGLISTHESVWGDILGFGNPENFSPYKIIFGLLSVPALLGLVRSSVFNCSDMLLMLGKYTFSIYLMNTIVIGLVKVVFFRIISWDGVNFLWYAPMLLVSGLFVPIAVKKYVLKRFAYLDKITN